MIGLIPGNGLFRDAKEEPIISVPSIHGGELINSSMKFLIMMSRGVYATYKEATGVSNKQVGTLIHFKPFYYYLPFNSFLIFLNVQTDIWGKQLD